MEQIRELIYAACMCGVLNAGVRLMSPDKLQKEMRMICTLMLIICLTSRIMTGFRIDTEALFSDNERRQEQYNDQVLSDTEEQLRRELMSRLEQLGIENADIGIVCTLDEYNFIKAEKVTLYLDCADEKEIQLAKNVAEELFPEAEKEVTANNDKTAEGYIIR